MKINKKIFKTILMTAIIVLMVLSNSCTCFAAKDFSQMETFQPTTEEEGGTGGGGESETETGKGSSIQDIGDIHLDDYKPSISGGKLFDITGTLLGWIIAIGAILITVFIALTGFGMILGSAEEKAVAKEKFVGYIIATVILTSGAALAKLIINIGQSL